MSFRIQPTNSDWFGTMTDSDFFFSFPLHVTESVFHDLSSILWLIGLVVHRAKSSLLHFPECVWQFTVYTPVPWHCSLAEPRVLLLQPWLVTYARFDSSMNISNQYVNLLHVRASAKCFPVNHFDVALFT